jgi:precorrin-3B synthase
VGCERACGAPTLDHVLVVDAHSVDDILSADGALDR